MTTTTGGNSVAVRITDAAIAVLERQADVGPETQAMLLHLAERADKRTPRIVALVPAYNEEESIARTVEALLAQDMPIDDIVIIPNNDKGHATDDTAKIALKYPVTVLELYDNPHRKSSALNTAWGIYARTADYVIGLDADTELPPYAVGNWVRVMEADAGLGGLSSKFTMNGHGFLTRLQRLEFGRWTQTSIQRGHTSVLAGTGCIIRGSVLRTIADRKDRAGPWAYWSAVEDFEMTFRVRELGFRCKVAHDVPAFTDSMKSINALWRQRMKWQVGTVHDLLLFGFNRLTARDWIQQALGLINALVRSLWMMLWILSAFTGVFHVQWTWWAFPLFFSAIDTLVTLRFKERARGDVLLSALLFPMEIFAWLRAGWFVASWWKILLGRHGVNDLWTAQYAADGTDTKE